MTESASEHAAHQTLEDAEHSAGLVSKGLAAGKVGTFSGAILGISCVAPGYTLTASIGLIVAAVGLKMPAIFIAGFIPMFLTAYAYRELNSRAPDCGASFTWSTKAFGPYVGLDVRVGHGGRLHHRAVQPRRDRGRVLLSVHRPDHQPPRRSPSSPTTSPSTSSPRWCSWPSPPPSPVGASPPVNGCSTCWSAFQMVVLVAFAVMAFVHVGRGDAPAGLSFDLDWFNPFTGLDVERVFVVGVTGIDLRLLGLGHLPDAGRGVQGSDEGAGPGRVCCACCPSWRRICSSPSR